MSQLTITLDDQLMAAAQAFAHRKGQQLDALVAEWLRTAVQPEATASAKLTRPLSPRIQRLYGSLKVDADFDYKSALAKAIEEKYGV